MYKILELLLFIIICTIFFQIDKKFQLISKLAKILKIPNKWIPFAFLCTTIILFLIFNAIHLNADLLKFIELILIIPFVVSTKYLYQKN